LSGRLASCVLLSLLTHSRTHSLTCVFGAVFQDLQDHTPEHHSDYASITEAKRLTEEVARQLNNAKRVVDTHTKVLQLEQQVKGLGEVLIMLPITISTRVLITIVMCVSSHLLHVATAAVGRRATLCSRGVTVPRGREACHLLLRLPLQRSATPHEANQEEVQVPSTVPN